MASFRKTVQPVGQRLASLAGQSIPPMLVIAALDSGCVLPDVGARRADAGVRAESSADASSGATVAPSPDVAGNGLGPTTGALPANTGTSLAGRASSDGGARANPRSADPNAGGGAGRNGIGGTGASVASDPMNGSAGRNAPPTGAGNSASSAGSRGSEPVVHVSADWPMPDASARSKTKPSYKTDTETVTDNVTGLIWQRHLPARYEQCFGRTMHYNGPERDEVGTACGWDDAAQYCESRNAASADSGWRVP